VSTFRAIYRTRFNFKVFSFFSLISIFGGNLTVAQTGSVKGKVETSTGSAEFVNVEFTALKIGTVSDFNGYFYLENVPEGRHSLRAYAVGYDTISVLVNIKKDSISNVEVLLKENIAEMNEVVVTGTMKESYITDSPIKVEVYSQKFFQKNKSANLFENLNMVNGVQPQLNCGVCNTGDIHINGMEGPYTFVLIDGMPIVSSLSTVYGFSSIPSSLIQRVEIVKGPSSTLYGSEAVAGVINIITKDPEHTPSILIDAFGTSHNEKNLDLSTKISGKKVSSLLSINYFNSNKPIDKNGDGFTDFALSNRFSIFNKIVFHRKNNFLSNLALRYYQEDRWGGQNGWSKKYRGSKDTMLYQVEGQDTIIKKGLYGESIYTKRVELIGTYQLPIKKETIKIQYSANYHNQNSFYGATPYNAIQSVGFINLLWDKQWSVRNNSIVGLSSRYTLYDDNTPATATSSRVFLPGIFAQNEFKLTEKHTILLGTRYDYNKEHGNIISPRVSYKFQPNKNNTFRLTAGNGFRVVNLFTEDHAALTGSRKVEIREKLKPERSLNVNLSFNKFTEIGKGFLITDLSGFYTYFTNKIFPDYDTDPNKIIYGNLAGYAISKGFSLNNELQFTYPIRIMTGITLMDVYEINKNSDGTKYKEAQVFAPKFSGTYTLSWTLRKIKTTIDYSGRVNGPMRLPEFSEPFARPTYSKLYALQNIQFNTEISKALQIYVAVKNLFNYTQPSPLINPAAPFSSTFDTSYIYGPTQNIRLMIGFRYQFDKKAF
jgi:outer membrane receptor for ferrienterochelin and colicins